MSKMAGVREQLQAILETSRPELVPFISSVIRPAIHLEVSPTPLNDLPVGASKLGGIPDLAGRDWPSFRGQEMIFIGQINLQDVRPYDEDALLPPQGLLSFFLSLAATVTGDVSDPDCCAVIHQPNLSEVKRAVASRGYFESGYAVPPQSIAFSATYHPYGVAFQPTPAGEQDVDLEGAVGDQRWQEIVDRPLAGTDPRPPFLLGCTLVAGEQFDGERSDETPLLTIGGTVGEGVFPFLDGSCIYAYSFILKSEDLQKRDFSRIRLSYDSS